MVKFKLLLLAYCTCKCCEHLQRDRHQTQYFKALSPLKWNKITVKVKIWLIYLAEKFTLDIYRLFITSLKRLSFNGS